MRSRIIGTGMGMPTRVVTNFDLEKIVDTSDEWIRTRTGIRERRFVDSAKGQTLSTIAIEAAREALERSGRKATEIDLVICCTTTPDTVLPNTAARVAGALGCLSTTGALDVNTACAGFVTGLHMADGLIRGGLHKNVLVIGTDVFSHVLDWTDRTTCVLFGDGAGAVVVTAVDSNDEQNDSIILGSKLFHIFDHAEALSIKAGGSRTPFSSPRFNVEERPYVTMQGQDVFKMGTRGMAQAAEEVLKLCGVDKHQLDWFVPHQANIRIIEMVAKLLDMSMDKVYVNIDRWGNSSAATVPVCLAEMNRAGMLKKGQLVLLDVFGGGFAYGALLMRW